MEKVPITRPMLTSGRRQFVCVLDVCVCFCLPVVFSGSVCTVGVRLVIKLVHQPAVCVRAQISLLMLPHTHTDLPLLLEGVCMCLCE